MSQAYTQFYKYIQSIIERPLLKQEMKGARERTAGPESSTVPHLGNYTSTHGYFYHKVVL